MDAAKKSGRSSAARCDRGLGEWSQLLTTTRMQKSGAWRVVVPLFILTGGGGGKKKKGDNRGLWRKQLCYAMLCYAASSMRAWVVKRKKGCEEGVSAQAINARTAPPTRSLSYYVISPPKGMPTEHCMPRC